MTHVRHNEDLTDFPFSREEETCDICQKNRVTGYWRTRTNIGVCFDCAVDALPKLIVDAWIHDMTDTRQAEKIEETMRASFWKGVASRISHDSKVVAERMRPGKGS